ncbi:ABC transporter permease [Actinoplanes sp. NEAU-A12]|uniref:ABC transporter permease n=1 Tax=Actinoplanes sandaracinus TaxID=3045177 RepID=A0ABT6WZ40_9ACTN|nr:ABC transporter permease [Actinoplanes sandaracinus]MDI6105015.1 ABC transporter permease [Actinoplanes sandaracinus]
MAYDETTFRRPGDEKTDTDPAAYRRRVQYDDTAGTTLDQSLRAPVAATGAGPAVEEDGRDRLGIHLGWEVMLLVAAAVIGFLLQREDSGALQRPALDALLVTGAAIGLLTLGAGLTLRAGVPNLALGPIALAAALQFAENGDKGLAQAVVPALIIAAAGGLAVGLLVTVLHVPGWAATLAAALGVIVFVQLRPGPVDVQGDWDPTGQAFVLFGAFAGLAVLGGAIGAIGPVRRFVGRMRSPGDPAQRRGVAAAVPVMLSLVLSSLFATVAGVLIAAQADGPIAPETGLEWTGIAIGLALLAGTSAYGRRGGIFGTLFAVTALTLFLRYQDLRDLDIALFAIAASLFVAGLVVTRVVEAVGSPYTAQPGEEWNAAPSGGATWSPTLPETWNTPATPAPRSDRWDEGPWGATR